MLNIYSIKYFQDAVTEKSITRAAQKNSVSPSAISQAIKQLEQHFEISLLKHKKNNFALTVHGRFFSEQSQSILDAVKAVEQEMAIYRDEPLEGTITFATQQSIATFVLPRFLAMFSKSFPGIVPHFRLGTSTVVENWISESTVDFALSLDNVSYVKGVSESVYRGKFVLVIRHGVALPTRKTIKDCKFLTTSSAEVLKLKRSFKKQYGSDLPVKMVIDSWSTIKRFCAEGEGIGFMPDYLLEKSDKLQILDPKRFGLPEFNYALCIICRVGKTFSPIEIKFMESLREHLRSEN